jgi:hypothetical protein
MEMATYSEATQSLLSRLRHPSIQQVLKSDVMLHPIKSNCIYIEIADNADAQITAHHFDDDEVIYTVELYVDNHEGDTKQVFSWTTTVWQDVRAKVLELKASI